jgi:hypothetical protein
MLKIRAEKSADERYPLMARRLTAEIPRAARTVSSFLERGVVEVGRSGSARGRVNLLTSLDEA